MIIDCCTKEEKFTESNGELETNHKVQATCCQSCGMHGKSVSRKTVLLMLKPEHLDQALTGMYRFCATSECSTVYFDEQSSHVFTTDDLRVIVGLKVNSDPIPACYCFGFEERHLREEISRTGSTTIPARISRLIREGLCACEVRNPAGVCCLGEVNRIAQRLKQESGQ